jgi:hypothetical protein
LNTGENANVGLTFFRHSGIYLLTINVPVVYMVRYVMVLGAVKLSRVCYRCMLCMLSIPFMCVPPVAGGGMGGWGAGPDSEIQHFNLVTLSSGG